MGTNPYQGATDKNLIVHRDQNGHVTSDGFSAGEKSVDVHPDGMKDFITNLGTLKSNLHDDSQRVTPLLRSLPREAFGNGGFRDGGAVAQIISANCSEFMQYETMLETAHQNIQMMMQTIKDSIGGEDDFSGVTMNAVKFACVLPGAERPDGLPSAIGKTWMDWYSDQLTQQANAQDPTGGAGENFEMSKWDKTGSSTGADGSTTVYFTDQFGNKKTITVNGGTTTTTVIPVHGKATETKESTTTTVPGLETTSTSRTDDVFGDHPQKTDTGSTVVDMTDEGTKTTTHYDGQGHATDGTTVERNGDGSTTTTTDSYDDKGKPHEDTEVTVGGGDPETPNPELNPYRATGLMPGH